ncbi:nitroreductase family protein [bacterium]|nr:nitroreductase family protein [bacterium]
MNASLLESIRTRFSVRKFDGRCVDREILQICLEAARLAPSAENSQPWRFLILDDPETIRSFGRSAFSGIYSLTGWAASAPVLIVLLAEPDLIAGRIGKWIQRLPFYLLDMGIAGTHLVLQAQSLGLGTCWIGWFDLRKTRKFFGLPKGIKVCGMIALGYPQPGQPVRKRSRKPLEELCRFNSWK